MIFGMVLRRIFGLKCLFVVRLVANLAGKLSPRKHPIITNLAGPRFQSSMKKSNLFAEGTWKGDGKPGKDGTRLRWTVFTLFTHLRHKICQSLLLDCRTCRFSLRRQLPRFASRKGHGVTPRFALSRMYLHVMHLASPLSVASHRVRKGNEFQFVHFMPLNLLAEAVLASLGK